MRQTLEQGLHRDLAETYVSKRANLLRFLTARLGSKAQAEDVVQDLFLKLATVDPDLVVENSTAMLYRMAANLAVDHVRHRRRAMARDHAWNDVQPTSGGDPMAEQASAEQALAARQSLVALMSGVEALPPRMRTAFRLHKIEGRTCAETAQMMGISVKAVEKHTTAALKALTWAAKR